MRGQGREEQDDLDKVFKALGHITRRRILRLLAQNPRYPYEISKMLGLTSRVILKHLEALQHVGFVIKERGESTQGPDRTYYRLNASFGLSTTILPNSFVIRVTQQGQKQRIAIPQGFIVPEVSQDVKAVRILLKELGKINNRLVVLDEERLRFANLRGQIIHKIEDIMTECAWDPSSCQRVRKLINPISGDEHSVENPLAEALEAFEKHLTSEKKKKKDVDEAVRIEFD
ncbi:MAG: ArsR/SmtB family transcription factor [Candidatus Thorarchaeota archaeon]